MIILIECGKPVFIIGDECVIYWVEMGSEFRFKFNGRSFFKFILPKKKKKF